jgi:DNA-directed RNA polymerase
MLWDKLTDEEKELRRTRQLALEEEMFTGGISKYWREYNRAPDEGLPEQQLLDSAVVHLAPFYQEWIDRLCENAKTPSWLTPLLSLGAGKMADITVRVLMREWLNSGIYNVNEGREVGYMNPAYPLPTAQKLSNTIAVEALNIIAFQQTKEEFKEDWRRQSKFIKNWTPKRCNAFSYKMGKLNPKTYSLKKRQDFGHHMLRIALTSGIVTSYTQRYKGGRYWKKRLFVGFSESILKDLHNKHRDLESFFLIYRPMIVPPVSHTMECSGGYLHDWVRKEMVQRFLSDYSEKKERKEQSFSTPSELVLKGLNAMMRTEWCVNERILEVMTNLFKNNTQLANLPPYNFDTFTYGEEYPAKGTKEEQAIWCNNREQSWGDWFKSEQSRARMLVRLSLAERLISAGFWYMPYTLDFRGRAYSTCELLSCQGSDFDKSLIQFAEPEEQTEEGRYWLKVQIANLFDQDKLCFDDRVKWVDDNMEMLERINQDPYMNQEWISTKVKKNPSFQRLASIFDLMRKDNLTQVPVQMDGACNGTQHWSAIMRDEVNAGLTNVIPSDTPQDLYQYVADKTTDYCLKNKDEIDWCSEFLDYWDNNIKREVTKRPTMCDSYGLTFYGIQKYVRLEGHLDWIPKESRGGAIVELSRAIKHGLDSSLNLPNEGKEYLKQIAGIASELNEHIVYTTPSGFKVVHRYMKLTRRRSFAALFNNKELTFATYSPTEIDKKQVEQAISPNWIHSLDASHMFCTLNRLVDFKLTNFSMVHDSYGCHAPKVPIMRKIIKEEFYEMHKHDLLKAFKEDVEQYLGIKLPALPKRGQFDVRQVLESDYFFS